MLATGVGLVAAVLGVLFVFARPWGVPHGVGLGLGIAAMAAAVRNFRAGSRRLEVVALLGLSIQLAVFVDTVAGTPGLTRYRPIQIAVLVSYLALLITALLVWLLRVSGGVASLTGALVALSVLGADIIAGRRARPIRPPPARAWPDTFDPDPRLGRIPRPNVEFKAYYPDDRRGYLREEDGRLRTWQLNVMPGSVASLVLPPESPERLRVEIQKATRDTTWHVQLSQAQFEVTQQQGYHVTFRARADRARTIGVAFGGNHPPWNSSGLYETIRLTPAWTSFREILVGQSRNRNSRLWFDLAGDDASVELDSVALRGLGGRRIEPVVPGGRFFVRYRTNASGCRDRDYPTFRPPNVARILLLGDGFTAGEGVLEEDTFARLLERQLAEPAAPEGPTSGREVINCGVRGYGTHEHRLFFESLGEAYRPDVLLVTMGLDDDLYYSDARQRDFIARGPSRLAQLSAFVRRVEVSLHLRRTRDYRPLIEDLLALDQQAKRLSGRLAVAVSRYGPAPLGDSLLAAVRRGLAQSDIPVLDLGRVEPTDSVTAGMLTAPGPEAHREVAGALRRWLETEVLPLTGASRREGDKR
ncbi:MAG: SGNH/GDSL hydrolase family protein [Gemmatimonadales bacterium]